MLFLNIKYGLQVKGGQLWGTDIYTDDSDLVAGMPSLYFLKKLYKY